MKHKWIQNFKDFILSEEKVPASLSQGVLLKIRHEILPLFRPTYQKFIAIQILAGMVTLLVCPQFGAGRGSQSGHHFVHSVITYGHWACAAFCASVFMGFAALITLIFLSRAEMKVLRSRFLLSIFLPPLVYIGVFLWMQNPEAIHVEFFTSPEYIFSWYIIAVVITALSMMIKARITRLEV